MTREALKEAVLKAIHEAQTESGEPEPDLNESTKPYDDLPNFDSLRVTEVETVLSDEIGVDVDFDALGSADDVAALSIAELVDGLLPIVNEKEKEQEQ